MHFSQSAAPERRKTYTSRSQDDLRGGPPRRSDRRRFLERLAGRSRECVLPDSEMTVDHDDENRSSERARANLFRRKRFEKASLALKETARVVRIKYRMQKLLYSRLYCSKAAKAELTRRSPQNHALEGNPLKCTS